MAASASRRQVILLAGLLAALAVVLAYQFWPSRGEPAAGAVAAAPTRSQAGGTAPGTVPDVRLEALQVARPEPIERGRNLFRDRPEPPPQQQQAVRSVPEAPSGPPPPPPISLKYIGLVQAGGRSVAVLSDGRDVLYGREGEVVDGRYLIVKINVETIEVSYPDGSGRRLIRLTG